MVSATCALVSASSVWVPCATHSPWTRQVHRAILVLSFLHTSTLSGDHIDCKLLLIVLEDWLAISVSSWV